MANLQVNPLRSFSDTTDQAPATNQLGRRFEDDNGDVYQLVLTSEALADGDAAQIDASAGNAYTVEQSNAGAIPMGLANSAIASGEYGFIKVKGTKAPATPTATPSAEEVAYAVASGAVTGVALGSVTAPFLASAIGVYISATVVLLDK